MSEKQQDELAPYQGDIDCIHWATENGSRLLVHQLQNKRPRDDTANDLLDDDDHADGRRTPTGLVVPSGATGQPRAPSTPPPAPVLRRSTTSGPTATFGPTTTSGRSTTSGPTPAAIVLTHVGTLANTGSATAAAAAATFVNAVGGAFRDAEDADEEEDHDMLSRELRSAREQLRGAQKRCRKTANADVQRLIHSAIDNVSGAIDILDGIDVVE